MTFRTFIIHKLTLFFMLTTLITVAIYITGSVFDPGARFGYESMLTPLVYSACCVLPTFVTYSKRELSAREMIPRMALELVLIEGVMLGLAFSSSAIDTTRPAVVLAIAGSVLAIYLLARLFGWLRDSAQAKQLNADLQRFQQQH